MIDNAVLRMSCVRFSKSIFRQLTNGVKAYPITQAKRGRGNTPFPTHFVENLCSENRIPIMEEGPFHLLDSIIRLDQKMH
ncbi:hypothetical protein TNCV_4824641 [Trichonephila clavipes]|uniref:Uncharacterized protein n=1 Tax=Trichonephila inaurata madagascariensis TaxID=2747483 RepID=A0A8X6XEN6_9ARAC|nr:hypothetical protein TNCV_4824641 [Trichonephila clavipes]GFY51312.1 hypothetical protein TNIN_139001 [Trichonephila inaurata madagascariensis]